MLVSQRSQETFDLVSEGVGIGRSQRVALNGSGIRSLWIAEGFWEWNHRPQLLLHPLFTEPLASLEMRFQKRHQESFQGSIRGWFMRGSTPPSWCQNLSGSALDVKGDMGAGGGRKLWEHIFSSSPVDKAVWRLWRAHGASGCLSTRVLPCCSDVRGKS